MRLYSYFECLILVLGIQKVWLLWCEGHTTLIKGTFWSYRLSKSKIRVGVVHQSVTLPLRDANSFSIVDRLFWNVSLVIFSPISMRATICERSEPCRMQEGVIGRDISKVILRHLIVDGEDQIFILHVFYSLFKLLLFPEEPLTFLFGVSHRHF